MAAAWHDYDDDGDLDVALMGKDPRGNAVAALYQNRGGSFIDTRSPLVPVFGGAIAWGDLDGNGATELVLSGEQDNGGYRTEIYLRDGDEYYPAYTEWGWNPGSLTIGDYDDDGQRELMLIDWAGVSIYRGNGADLNDAGFQLELVDQRAELDTDDDSVALWADYDGDFDLDVAILSYNRGMIYRNDGGAFSQVAALDTSGEPPLAAWGDADGDGDLDLAVSVYHGWGSAVVVYEHEAGRFDETLFSDYPYSQVCTLAWADLDADGDQDLLLGGPEPSFGVNYGSYMYLTA
jgi:hypothetical protein